MRTKQFKIGADRSITMTLELTTKEMLAQILCDQFFCRNTPFSSGAEMLRQGNFHLSSTRGFNRFIAAHTRFRTWDELFDAAVKEWADRSMGGAEVVSTTLTSSVPDQTCCLRTR